MKAFTLYMILKMDAVSEFCAWTSGALAIFLIILLAIWSVRINDGLDTTVIKMVIRRSTWWAIPLSFIFLVVAVLMPSTKQMAVILVVPKVVNSVMSNEEFMKLPSEIVSTASAWIKELRPDKDSISILK